MCGISGYVSEFDKYSKNVYNLENIKHRGPDSNNNIKFKYKNFNISLSFFRLAIIDIKNGMQPFIYENENRKVYLLCNGEIYNYKKIIEEYVLNTKSDCHVILDLYLKFGIMETLKVLDGEFAFVLLDLNDDDFTVYFCRDRFGIRPLFYNLDENGFCFSSEFKGLVSEKGQQVEPRKIHKLNMFSKNIVSIDYYTIERKYYNFDVNLNMHSLIRGSLITSVKDRLNSERPIGCLLSGGLDSSLIAGIASKLLKEENKKLHTFSIGMDKDSPDIEYARKVANFIESIHHEVIIPVEEWIETLPNVIKQIETYDITTIRATTGQYLLAKWISKNTDIKVLLNGDGSDEICSGYIYFYNAPDAVSSHNENIRLLNEIHKYDVLRVDRGISAFGLEARVPFLAHYFVDLYISIDKSFRNPIKNIRMEKDLLRKSFINENIIPEEVLLRKKEAFSDGVSSHKKSWFEYIQEYVDTQVSDDEFEKYKNNFPSKEAYWYKKIFDETYPNSGIKFEYWMPKWCSIKNEPSARVLKEY